MLSVVSSVNTASVKSLTAVDKLRELLVQLEDDGVASPPSKAASGSLGSTDLYILVQAAEEISHRLREENDALKMDNERLRSNLVALIEENNRLHEEIGGTFVTDMLRLISLDDGRQHTDDELRIVDMYAKKMRSLEMELRDAKERLNSLVTYEHESDETAMFGEHLREGNARLTDLIEENEANRHKIQQLQGKLVRIEAKERDLSAKLQESLRITEQCQAARAEAILERDQRQRELIETQQRLRRLIDETGAKAIGEAARIEVLCRNPSEDKQMEELRAKCVQHELTIDRLAREKTSLAADLDVWKEQIQRQEFELSQAADSVKRQIQEATRERDQANSAAMHIRSEFEQLLLQSSQGWFRLRQQLGSMENRLHEIESELLHSKKQCLDSNEEINRLTREIVLLKSTKQALEHSRDENKDAILVILKQREDANRQTIENLAVERQQSLAQLEDLVQHQNTIVRKLRSYCRALTDEIEKTLGRKHELVQNITLENQELRMKLANAYAQLEHADAQLIEHGEMHTKLKQRISELNNKIRSSNH